MCDRPSSLPSPTSRIFIGIYQKGYFFSIITPLSSFPLSIFSVRPCIYNIHTCRSDDQVPGVSWSRLHIPIDLSFHPHHSYYSDFFPTFSPFFLLIVKQQLLISINLYKQTKNPKKSPEKPQNTHLFPSLLI